MSEEYYAQPADNQFKINRGFYIFLSIVIILAVIFTNPMSLPFWPFTTNDIVTLLTNFALIALLIERAVEVILAVTRAKDKRIMKAKITIAQRRKKELSETYDVIGQKMKGPANSENLSNEMLEIMKSTKGAMSRKDDEMEKVATELTAYAGTTKIISMIYAFTFGIISGALGFRILEPLVDPAVFKQLEGFHKSIFAGFDVLITGAVLGGGSNGIHKILDTFLSWFDKTRLSLKGDA